HLRPLAQLQVLTLHRQYPLKSLTELLQVLLQLHTLQLPAVKILGHQQLDTLLAATQIASLQLREVEALGTSYADAPCSWQRLELAECISWKVLASLPLHSLSQPLVLHRLHICEKGISNPEVAAALHNMAYACKAPVKIKRMWLTALSMKRGKGVGSAASVIGVTPASIQQQRVDLAQLLAMLQPLQCCDEVETAPAMSQRDMQHQVTVDGGASATDGYNPASEAPPPATRLLDLPPALLDDIACRVMQLGARSLLPLTCRAFSLAHLPHIPALRIQLGRQCCDQLLTPRVVAALQARTSKLALTLWQPETEDSFWYNKQLAPTLQLPQTEYTQQYTDLLAHVLAKLDNCAAVEVCKLVSSGTYDSDNCRHLRCSPGLAQHLLDSFPSLTALTLDGLIVSSDALASMLSHPPLASKLQQLDLTDPSLVDGDMEPGAVGTLLQGLQLKQLSVAVVEAQQLPLGTPPLPIFQPLAQHLTQLNFYLYYPQYDDDPRSNYLVQFKYLVDYLQPLAQLQVLTLPCQDQLEGLTELLQALPELHTLRLPAVAVLGQQRLDALLAATRITTLQLGTVEGLHTSYADAPCSWQRLELMGSVDWKAITCLPLHSLSQPLLLRHLEVSVEDTPDPEMAAAFQLLAYACKVPVKIKSMLLTMLSLKQQFDSDDGWFAKEDEEEEEDEEEDEEEEEELFVEELFAKGGSGPVVITPAYLRQQRVELAQLVAMLQPLQFCCVGKVVVRDLHKVTAADVLALAPLCRDCTYFGLTNGSMEPSLEFWRQLVQLMPALQDIDHA
ncbi:hypothetical protein QJQ45_027100, partial [Haematococcus lacustris]